MSWKRLRLTSVALAILLLGVKLMCAEETAETLFVRRVAPLLQEKCIACHGRDSNDIKGRLDLRSRQSMLKGGESKQPMFAPENADKSPLLLAITRSSDEWSAMPPKEAERLSDEQIGWVKKWISGGAPWPDAIRSQEILRANSERWSAEDGVALKTSGGTSPEWTSRKYKSDGLWAYQPVQKPNLPANGVNPIDALIMAGLPPGLAVAPCADRVTLIRRATFDLIGLPPRPTEVQAFVEDTASDAVAFAKVIDRLLESPHYGERMAQHWLDVVRYADSSGFANDYERGNAWRYRDYVVRSFNSDKPYDLFIREQIAGDEIYESQPEEDRSIESLIATGFLRMGPWELTGMEVAKVARQRFLDDVTNSVGEAFLAHSLQCARCHDHKFDPIPTRDYYSIQAVFATTQIAERSAPFIAMENTKGFEEKAYLEKRSAEYLATLARLDEQLLVAAKEWYREKKLDPAQWNEMVERAQRQPSLRPRRDYKEIFNTARSLMMKEGVPQDEVPPRFLGFTPQDYGHERVARKGLERLRWEFERYEPFALAVYNGRTPQYTSVNSPIRIPANRMNEGELEETCILTGGDPFGSGDKVSPGILSVLGPLGNTPITMEIEGRRKAFAEWVASADNPLTTRSIVNRIWLWHFNQPIAGNPNNFGSTGKKPTHPELLDWLAATFVENGWRFKSMHRLIMNSDAYRRSSKHPDRKRLLELDPLETRFSFFRPRRLTAEELRDAMLFTTAELNPTLGGIPNRPEINLEASLQPRQVMGTFAAAWVPNPLPQQRHRRSLYALKLRGQADPFLEVFNSPSPDFSCESRESSTVTPQVFSLFNSQSTHSRALALAARVTKECSTDEEALTRCFNLALSRSPTKSELAACLTHWREVETMDLESKPVEFRRPLEVRRDAVEENTGERFSFDETLHSNADFVPDLLPSEVSVHTRALADVCLVIFNLNEFVYVY